MKKLVYLSLLLVLVLGTVTVAAQAPEKPAPVLPDRATLSASGQGINSLTGSYVAFDPSVGGDSQYYAGLPGTFCFRAESYSPDWEYVYDVWLKFPTDWTVTNAYLQGTPYCDMGGTWGTFTWSFETAPYEIDIYHPRYQANNPAEHCVAYYCVEAVAGFGVPPAPVSWFYDGDGYNNTPHWPCSNDGYAPPGFTCDEMINPTADVPGVVESGIFLTPEEQFGSACEEESVTYTLNLFNNSGSDGTFGLAYDSVFPISGPANIFVADLASADFDVTVTVPCGGQGDVATVTATGNGYDDSATLTTTKSEGGWAGAWQLENNSGAIPQQWGSCAVNNDMGYYIAGLDSVGGVHNAFQMFDGATWTQLATFPQYTWGHVAGWIDGLLYVAGGGDSGFVGYTNLWIWDGSSWTAGPAMPAARLGGAGGAAPCFGGAGTCLWVAGGTPDGYFTSFSFNVYEYNPATGAWTQRSSVPGDPANYGQALGAGTVCNGKVYFGGDYRGIADWFGLDPVTDTWTQLADIPAAAGKMTAATVCGPDNNVYLIGGDSLGYWGDTYNAKVFQYDVLAGTWTQMAQSINQGLLGSCGLFFNDKMYTFGGTNGSYALTPAPHESLEFADCEPCGGNTLTCGAILAQPAMDPYGRIYVRWKVEAIDQYGANVALVAVDANLWSPQGGPFARTRWTHLDGFAKFPWGSWYSGNWTIDVTNMTLAGYTFLDGGNCTATGYW